MYCMVFALPRIYLHAYLSQLITRTCIYNYVPDEIMCAGTPVPNVALARSSLDSLFICWSVSSTEYLSVTNYTVYWSGPSAETSKTNSTSYNNYTIKGLRSNSLYTIAVEAIDPLGRQNSTNHLYFTSPIGLFVYIHIYRANYIIYA